MFLKRVLPAVFGLILVGCNQDDEPGLIQEELSPTNFSVIGLTTESVFQYDYDATAESGELTNLTLEIGVPVDYLTLRQTGNLLSFYTFGEGTFSLWLKNIESGETDIYADFFANSAGRSFAWGINDETNVFFGFFGPNGERNLGIQDVVFSGDLDGDLIIDENIDFTYQPLLFEDKIYLTYRDEVGNYKLTYYDTVSKTASSIVNFGPVPISIFTSELGEIVVIKNGANPTLELFDADSLVFIESKSLQFGTAFNQGPIYGAVFKDDKLYYAYPFVQPALYDEGPAIFDLATGENTIFDLAAIAQGVEAELGVAIGITSQIYDAAADVFLVGYASLGDDTTGGILQISTAGELIANISLPFFPNYIVL
ncbi:hypothetical protein [Croceivirga thetidis]|uniref:Uncharacterized protein n=1 Tax=Croceivirga thetidis TaxID=2721623 RepID=A0ABX1GQ62_9FLAO|nr:hypothetical protein [Croceivirga thetidis]NKI31095.1 hypothetical protein [Croceivirga thetidis]